MSIYNAIQYLDLTSFCFRPAIFHRPPVAHLSATGWSVSAHAVRCRWRPKARHSLEKGQSTFNDCRCMIVSEGLTVLTQSA